MTSVGALQRGLGVDVGAVQGVTTAAAGIIVAANVTLPLIQSSVNITLAPVAGSIAVAANVTLPLITASSDITLSGGTPGIGLIVNTDRTTIIAGEAVFFDVVGTTSTQTAKPLHHIYYLWDFKDASNFDNSAKGFCVGHTFRDPGTYSVTCRARDRHGNDVTNTTVITVQDPDTIYSGTNTISFSNDADFTGSATGSTKTTSSNLSDVVAAIERGKRVELKRGDVWSTSVGLQFDISTGTVTAMVTAFGTGAKPIMRGVDPISGTMITHFSGDQFALRDIRFEFTSLSAGLRTPIKNEHTIEFITIADCEVDNFLETIIYQDSTTNYYGELPPRSIGLHRIVGSNRGSWIYAGIAGVRVAIVGNFIPNGTNHCIRFYGGDYFYLANSDIGQAGAGFNQLKAHSSTYVTDANISRYWNLHNNVWRATSAEWQIAIGTQNAQSDQRTEEILIDSDYIDCSDPGQFVGLFFFGVLNPTARNMILDNKTKGGSTTMAIGRRGPEPLPTGAEFYHCLQYTSGNIGAALLLSIETYGAGTPILKNCIVDAVDASSAALADKTVDGGGSLVGDAQFVDPANQVFSLKAGSTALDNGVLADVINAFNPGAALRVLESPADSGAYEQVISGVIVNANVTLPLIQSSTDLNLKAAIAVGANVTLPLITSTTDIDITFSGSSTITLTKGAIHNYSVWPRSSADQADDVWLDGIYTSPVAFSGQWRIVRFDTGAPVTNWTQDGFSMNTVAKTFTIRDAKIPVSNFWHTWEIQLADENGTLVESYKPDIGSGRFRWAVGVNVLAIGQSNMEAFMTGRLNLSPNPTDPIGQCGPAWTEPLGDGAIQFGNELHAALNVPIGMLTSATGATSLTPKADIAAGAIGWWMDFKEPKGPGNGYLFQKTNALFDIPTTLWNDTNSYIPPRVEGMLIYQGEAEAIAVSVTDFTNNSLNGPGEYRGLLRQVLEFYRERCASWNGKPPVAVMELSANRSVSYDNAQSQAIGYQPGMAYDAVRDAVLQMGAMHDWVYPVFTADGALDDHIHMDETAFVIYATRCANALRHYHAGGGDGWEPVITDPTVGTVGPYLSYAYQQDLQTIRVKTIIDTTTTMVVPAGASNTFVVYRSDVTGQNMIPVDGVFWDEPSREIVLNLEVPLRTPLFELEYAGHADLDPLDLIKDGNGYPLQHTFGASEKKGELKNVDTQNGLQYHQAAPIVGSRYLPGSLAGPHTTHGIAGNVTGGTDSSPIILGLSLSVIAGMKFTVFRWTGPNVSEYVGTGIIRERLGDTLTLSKAITGLVIGDTMTFDVASSFIAGLTPTYIPTNHHESGQSMIGIGLRSHTSAPTATTMNIKRGD